MSSVKPKTEYVLNFTNLQGGLNIYDPEYMLASNETPEMVNLLWKNGMLCSRKGQAWAFEEKLGTGYAMYERVWNGCLVCHIGGSLYALSAAGGDEGLPQSAGADSSLKEGAGLRAEVVELCSDVPEVRGTFFAYNDCLYYKTAGLYKVISYDGSFSCSDVEPYVPVILMNAAPSTAAGDTYQPENRMSPRKTVWYNAVSGVVSYYLPVAAAKIIDVYVDGVRTTAFSYNSQKGLVRFTTAPPVTDPPTNNTDRITYELANAEYQASIDGCRYAATYGGTGALCVCFAGYAAQPNAMFWNGQDSLSMNPAYFPASQYQLCGETEERITGFGKQQSDLVIFKEHSVGKATMATVELDGRLAIDLPYIPINAKLGCRFPWSIQLVSNNLVWANDEGVFTMLDTTAAQENTILCLSKKVKGSLNKVDSSCSLLCCLAASEEDAVCALDDDHRYYLTANGSTWVWDYELSTETKPSWFYLNNTHAIAYCGDFSLNSEGQITMLTEELNDYGEPIDKMYRFAVMNFGSYDCRKNVNSVIVILGSEKESVTELIYRTDYEARPDLTPLCVGRETPSVAFGASSLKEGAGLRAEEFCPAVFRRRPMCRRVLHFTMLLVNANVNEDLEIIGAQIFYNLQGRLR